MLLQEAYHYCFCAKARAKDKNKDKGNKACSAALWVISSFSILFTFLE